MSQYYTIQTIDGVDTVKYQTLQTTTTATVSSVIAGRRILITTGNVAQSVCSLVQHLVLLPAMVLLFPVTHK
jgi:hypothetical protein